MSANTYGSLPSGTLQFACTAGLPSGAACAFSPASALLPTSVQTILTVTTSAGSRAAVAPPAHTLPRLLVTALLLTLFRFRRRDRRATTVSFLVATLLLVSLSGCGSSSSTSSPPPPLTGNTPPGTYPITVTVTSGAALRTFVVTLIVAAT